MTTILVIDDDAGLRALVGRFLGADGHLVLEAGDGRRALEMVAAQAVELCIVDIFMPLKDGLETISELRAAGCDCRILAISGGGSRGNLDYLEHARMFGADAVLMKPFSRDVLRAAVAEAMAAGRDGGEGDN